MDRVPIFGAVVRHIEESQAPLWYFGFSFLAATLLRTFLEIFSDNGMPAYPVAHIFEFLSASPRAGFGLMATHYTLSYAALGLTLILLLYAVLRVELITLFKVVSVGFLVLCSVPVFDLVLSGGRGYVISYLIPQVHGDLLPLFFTFFGPLTATGVTPGMRIEVAFVVLAIFLYAYTKGRTVLRSAVAALSVYALIFFYIASPYLLSALAEALSVPNYFSALALLRLFVLVLCAAGGALVFLQAPAPALVVLRDIRAPRLAHYWFMFAFGILCAERAQGSLMLSAENMLSVPLVLLSVAAAWGFSVITNNMADVGIDAVSNPSRPLVASAISLRAYRAAAVLLLAVALLCAFAVSAIAGFLVALFIGNYFIYSMPPLRLKRVPLFSKLVILINSAGLAMAGFSAFTVLDAAGVARFAASLPALPFSTASMLFFALLLAANFIDIKDYEGDKQEGINTLPVLLGLPLSKALIGGAFFFLYSAVGLYIGGALAYVAVAAGALQCYVINRRRYEEAYVFWLYLPSLAVLLCVL